MFTPLAVVRDVRTKGTGASRMEPYWTDSSLARARLSPQGAKRHVLHRFGHRGSARRCASSQQFHFVPWDMQVAECTRGMVDEESKLADLPLNHLPSGHPGCTRPSDLSLR